MNSPNLTAADFASQPVLLDVHSVSKLLACSARHVYRLADAGKMPRPLKLGKLVRWPRGKLEDWVAKGCPPKSR